jgi:dephospho-CoA kinase
VTLRIGLTGPIGCGKSTVAGWLAHRGATVVDADRVAREILGPGEPAVEAVVERFGPEVLGPDGSIDRAALGRIVFGDPVALRDLEAIVHPLVRPRILAAIAAAQDRASPAVVVEAIKLVEGGLADVCDEVWLVTCAEETQRARLAGRGMAGDDARQRIAAQRDLLERIRARATRVLDTSGDTATTEALVGAAYEDAVQAAGRRADSG